MWCRAPAGIALALPGIRRRLRPRAGPMGAARRRAGLSRGRRRGDTCASARSRSLAAFGRNGDRDRGNGSPTRAPRPPSGASRSAPASPLRRGRLRCRVAPTCHCLRDVGRDDDLEPTLRARLAGIGVRIRALRPGNRPSMRLRHGPRARRARRASDPPRPALLLREPSRRRGIEAREALSAGPTRPLALTLATKPRDPLFSRRRRIGRVYSHARPRQGTERSVGVGPGFSPLKVGRSS